MPGMSPETSHLVKRPSITELIFVVTGLSIAAASGDIHILLLPSHVPMPLARNSWFGPGVPACWQVTMSAICSGVSFSSGWFSFEGWCDEGGSCEGVAFEGC